jgi:hypothetical protein
MQDMIWFEDIGERTSTLPFFINSQIDMAGFVNLHKMAPVKSAFSHLQSAQNKVESSYFNLVPELHITMQLFVQSLAAQL